MREQFRADNAQFMTFLPHSRLSKPCGTICLDMLPLQRLLITLVCFYFLALSISAQSPQTEVDYDKAGKQIGHLYLPYSVTRSAYGNIALPVAIIANGKGPTVFLQAGTHGDEYEGQIALCKLVRELDAATVNGRIIVMTATNLPAALAGARVSPLDGGNLNRAYPGDPEAGPTKAIAHYVDSVIFPMTDYHLDLHSGGSSLDYQPFVSMPSARPRSFPSAASSTTIAMPSNLFQGKPSGAFTASCPSALFPDSMSISTISASFVRMRRLIPASLTRSGRP